MHQESGSWTVVQFTNDSSVEAVPTNWISPNNLCFWPPFSAEKVALAIKHQDLDTCWPTYKVDIFRNGTYDQYDIARAKARRAEQTSDLNTDVELDVRRKKANKRYLSSTSEEEEVYAMKSPPRMKILKKKVLVEKVLGFEEQSSAPAFVSMETDEQSIHNNQNGSTLVQDANPICVDDTSIETTPALMQNKNIASCTCCPVHSAYLRSILKSQQTNRSLLIEALEQIKLLQNKGHPSEEQAITTSVFEQFDLPVHTLEDIVAISNFLKSGEVFSKAVLEISRLGGQTNYDIVRRILPFLITNELGSKYSWLGRRDKLSFKTLEIARLIIEVTQLSKTGTIQETEASISKWLRRANDRSKGGAKK